MDPAQHAAHDDGPDALDPTGVLTRLAAVLDAPQTLEMALTDIVAIAKDNLPGADDVSITVIEEGRPSTIASTGSLAADMDERQYDLGWGPCLDAAQDSTVLMVADVSTDTRWPDYTATALKAGVASSMSAPLPTHERFGGALNIYSRSVNAFDDSSRRLAASFAGHVAVALNQTRGHLNLSRKAETLQEAMRSRAVIEQAKGILMALHKRTAEEAFETLIQVSQQRHIKLRDVAAQIVEQASDHPVRFDDP